MTRTRFSFFLLMISLTGCSSMVNRFLVKSLEQIGKPVEPAPVHAETILRSDANVSVLWSGHATVLIQIGDKVFLTDPLFTRTVGMVMKRAIEAGLDPSRLPYVDFTLISHIHFDHFSFGSLDMLPKRGALLLPYGALAYTPDFGFEEMREMKPWEALERDGVRITAVPVQHFSGRYGFDMLWMQDRGYTGYVIEYRGTTVFFGGDTGYHSELFKEIGRRYSIDLAILPIGPIEPRDFMERNHVDPAQALQIFQDVGARMMLPMHHRTIVQGFDPSPLYASEQLIALARQAGLSEKILLLDIGQQEVLD